MGITAKLNIDEVLSGLDDLISKLSDIPDNVSSQVDVEGIDEVSQSADEAEINLQQVGEAAGMVGTDLNSIDTSGLEGVSDAAESTDLSLQSIGEAAGMLGMDLSSIDTSGLEGVSDSADSADLSLQAISEAAAATGYDISNIDTSVFKDMRDSGNEAAEGLEEAADAAGLLEAAFTTLLGIGIIAYLDGAADAAGSRADEWSRLNVNIGGTSKTLEATKKKYTGVIGEIQSVTKRSFGDTLTMLDQFAVADITNIDAMKNLGEAVSGTTFKLADQGATMGSVTSATTRMVSTGNLATRQLKALGITTEDLTRVTGMSADEAKKYFQTLDTNGRAAFLANILNANGAKEGNIAYASSWEHLNDALDMGFDAIQRLVGELILPILIPAIEFAIEVLEGVADVIEGIPDGLQPIIGIIALVSGVVTTLAGAWAGFVTLIGGDALLSFSAIGTAITGTEIGLGGLLASIGPLGWAILAIIGIVLSAIYIWQNWSDEIIQLKDNIMSGNWGAAANQIGGAFQYIGDAVWNALQNAGQILWNFFANLPAMIGNFSSWYYDMGINLVEWIVEGLMSLSNYLDTILLDLLEGMADTGGEGGESSGKTVGENTGKGIIDGLTAWINTNGPKIVEILGIVFMQILPLLVRLVITIMSIVAIYMYNYGRQAGSRLVTGIISFVLSLPGRLGLLLLQAALKVLQFGSAAYSYARTAGSRIVSGVISAISSLPGKMYSWGMKTLSQFIRGIYNSIPGLASALALVKKYLPSSPPKTGPLSETTEEGWYEWMSSLADAGIRGLTSLYNLEGIVLPDVAALNVAAGSSDHQTSYRVTIKKGAVQIAGNATAEVIDKAGELLGGGIARGAVSDGINTRINLQ